MEQPTFDIQTPSTQSSNHRGIRIVWILVAVLLVLAAVYVVLQMRQKRAFDAYIRTSQGQLEALSATSDPVTSTPEERYAELLELQKSTGPGSTLTQEDRINVLEALE